MTPKSEALRAAWAGARDNDEAVRRLQAAMRRDRALYAEIMAPWETRAAQEAIAQARVNDRHAIWSEAGIEARRLAQTRAAAERAGSDARVRHLVRVNRRSMFDLRLPSGVRLGDATRAEVAAAAEYYAARARQHGAKAGFFAALAARLPEAGRVREAELLELRAAA